MKPLAPYRGTLFRLALTNALLVGMIGFAFFHAEDLRAQKSAKTQTAAGTGVAPPTVATNRAREAATTAVDEDFLRAAAELAVEELRLAEVGARRATRPEVRAFSQQFAMRQQAMRSELETLAAQKGVLLPTGDARPRDTDALISANHARFDDAFVEWTKVRHGTAVQIFERAADRCVDPDLRVYAQRMLPVLKAQHEHARRLRRTVF